MLQCNYYTSVAHQIDGQHVVRCKAEVTPNCTMCLKHASQQLTDLYTQQAKLAKELREVDTKIADLESALEI